MTKTRINLSSTEAFNTNVRNIIMKLSIQYEPNPGQEDIQKLFQGIITHAKQQKGHKPMEPFGFFIRDENGNLLGGCNGNIGYGWIYVDQLWVDEAVRCQGYGTALMQVAEKLGRERRCIAAAVNTMDWEALDFYKKLGYRIEFERNGLANNSIYYYLHKDFFKSDHDFSN